jgi:diketogulonate reductase-like aldo/keto reductase
MEKAQEQGLVKSIGVSNLSTKKLGEVLSYAKIPPAVNQIELHPGWRNDKMLAFAKEKGVHLSVGVWAPSESTRGRRIMFLNGFIILAIVVNGECFALGPRIFPTVLTVGPPGAK